MKYLVILIALVGTTAQARGSYVRSYTKQNGTRVNAYHRSEGNHTRSDNYSHKGNVNPYTGKAGNKN